MSRKKKKRGNLKFLEDIPTIKDEFGSHERIVDSIYEIIKKEKGGKAIALIGEWGSGKSSIVEMLKKKIEEKNDEIGVFIFDSWEHEGDALRRAFINELIYFLAKDKGWLEYKEEKNEMKLKDEILQREWTLLNKKISRTTSHPILPFGGRVLILLLYLAPLWLLLLEKCPSWDKLFLYFSPILWVVLWTLGMIIKGKESDKENKNEDITLFFSGSTTQQVAEKYESPDPTSLEFEKFYGMLLGKIFTKPKSRKLIVVIDNLDRVMSVTALRLLSTIKPFIQSYEKKNNKEEYQKVWYIIPFDRKGLERIWETNKDAKDDLAKAFIDKTFQIKISIPPLILSRWQRYFEDRLKEAGIEDERERIAIRRVFEVLYYNKKKEQEKSYIVYPSPREIKLFINNLVASIMKRREDDIPYKYHAIFVGVREYHKKIFDRFPEKIISEELPEQDKLDLRNNWKEDLLVLYYNVEDKNDVWEILFAGEIEKALEEGNPEFFNKEEFKDENVRDKIKRVTERIVRELFSRWRGENPYLIGYALYALPEDFLDEMEGIIIRHLKGIKRFYGLDKRAAGGICKFVARHPDKAEEVLSGALRAASIGIPQEREVENE